QGRTRTQTVQQRRSCVTSGRLPISAAGDQGGRKYRRPPLMCEAQRHPQVAENAKPPGPPCSPRRSGSGALEVLANMASPGALASLRKKFTNARRRGGRKWLQGDAERA